MIRINTEENRKHLAMQTIKECMDELITLHNDVQVTSQCRFIMFKLVEHCDKDTLNYLMLHNTVESYVSTSGILVTVRDKHSKQQTSVFLPVTDGKLVLEPMHIENMSTVNIIVRMTASKKTIHKVYTTYMGEQLVTSYHTEY